MEHDHSSHMGLGQGDNKPYCKMNMVFNWHTNNLCIVFDWWLISSLTTLLLSLVAVVFLTAGYEALRELSRRYESMVEKAQENLPRRNQVEISKRAHIIKAVLYACQTFYAFMLMLMFMTYNGWVMLAMFVGSFVGYLSFGGSTPATKETACH